MKSDDLTLRVLIEIRERIDQTNTGLATLSDRVDQTNTGLADLSLRVAGLEQTVSTELHAVHATLTDVATVMKGRRALTRRVDRCERDIADLKRRVG